MIVARVLYEFNSSQQATNALVFGFSGFDMHGVLAETGVGQVVLLGDVWGDEVWCRSCGLRDGGWDEYLVLACCDSFTGYIGIEEARDGGDKDVALGTDVEVDDLHEFWGFWI